MAVTGSDENGKFSWTFWPAQGLSAENLKAIEDELKGALGEIEFEESLVKSSTAPIHVVLTWLAQSVPRALLGVFLAKAVDALVGVTKRARSQAGLPQMTLELAINFSGYTVEVYGPGDAMISASAIMKIIHLCQTAAASGTNAFGVVLDDMFGEESPVLPGGVWPEPIRKIGCQWDPISGECKLLQVEIRRGCVYVPGKARA